MKKLLTCLLVSLFIISTLVVPAMADDVQMTADQGTIIITDDGPSPDPIEPE